MTKINLTKQTEEPQELEKYLVRGSVYNIEVTFNKRTGRQICERRIVNVTPRSKVSQGAPFLMSSEGDTDETGIMPSVAFFGNKRHEADRLEIALSVEVHELYH
jgi:hypothetical protein